MPRVKRRQKGRDTYALTFYQVMALMVGWRDPLKYPFIPQYQLGYNSREELKAAWELHRDNLRICQWREVNDPDYRPGRRPWAWWEFDSPELRNRKLSQAEQLAKMKVLEPHEILEVERARRRKANRPFDVPEPEGGFAPLPEAQPLAPDVLEMCKRATEKVKRQPWFKWVARPNGLLSPADADAVLNHGCTMDLERGFFVCDFLETFCKQCEGEWEGQFLELMNWQVRDLLLPLFAWVTPEGVRRFTDGSVWISKKQGKSTTCAGLECYGACGDGEGGPRVFSAAVTKEQADIVHGWAANMIHKSPELSRLLEVKDSKKEIHFVGESSFVIKALAAEANSNEGKHIFMLFLDELHAWVDAKFFGALIHGNAARRQPLTLSISTSGDDLDSLGGKRYLYTKRIIVGELANYSYFALIYEAPPTLDYEDPRVFMNPEVWRMANPSLGITTSYRNFYDALLKARSNPKDWADFLRYRLNQWVGAGTPYLSMGAWYDCGAEEFSEKKFDGEVGFTGLDMSISDDTSSLVHCFPIDKLYYFLWRCWVPEETVRAKFKEGDTKWQQWVDAGLLIQVPGFKIDHEIIFDQFRADAQLFALRELAFDKFKADWLTKKIEDSGVPVVEFNQNAGSYDFATKEFKSLCDDKRLRVGKSSIVSFQASSLSVKTNFNNQDMPLRRAGDRKFKIDLMVAAIMALDRALRHVDETSIYEDKTQVNPFPTEKKS